MRHAPQFRFWTYENGTPVRIKIERGQTLNWWAYSLDDEGWSSRAVTWSIDDERNVLVAEYISRGRDCDGLHESGATLMCAPDELENGADMDGVRYPNFKYEEMDLWQRDHYAEQMGY
jgi:hypothetical protein